ncbi:hypothetical protein TNCV_2821861 [Trichonephila clavipes]|uniref:Uncharacterized protein n=1 Tax=Trichonephila clavipes TaxID=2585209 RepID=A0A8X7BKF0_TRICX|nr:hypothetical protein TNCV_2821861 [Trichonephila clavipes]
MTPNLHNHVLLLELVGKNCHSGSKEPKRTFTTSTLLVDHKTLKKLEVARTLENLACFCPRLLEQDYQQFVSPCDSTSRCCYSSQQNLRSSQSSNAYTLNPSVAS